MDVVEKIDNKISDLDKKTLSSIDSSVDSLNEVYKKYKLANNNISKNIMAEVFYEVFSPVFTLLNAILNIYEEQTLEEDEYFVSEIQRYKTKVEKMAKGVTIIGDTDN